MIKADSTVCRETKYIAFFCAICSIVVQCFFLLIKRWDYTVLLGNLLSLVISVGNFYLMGISVQKALSAGEAQARNIMKTSQSLRNIGIFIGVMIGVILPYFNTVCVILPIFFPRIAVSFRPLFKEKEVIDK